MLLLARTLYVKFRIKQKKMKFKDFHSDPKITWTDQGIVPNGAVS